MFYRLSYQQVNTLWAEGKQEEAKQAAATAKNWSIAAICTGLIMLMALGIFYAVEIGP